MRLHLPSLLLGLLAALALGLVLSARPQQEPATPEKDRLVLELLQSLTKSQERQAVAWEVLAQKGWPMPQSVTISAEVPKFMTIDLTGNLSVSQNGTWNVTRF